MRLRRARRLRRILIAGTAAGVLAGGTLQGSHVLAARAYRGIAPLCGAIVRDRVVALSFDDGPSLRASPQVLALMESQGDGATFFVVGRAAAEHPDLVRDEVAAGMELGNHTWSHARLSRLSANDVLGELAMARAELVSLGAPAEGPMLARPPYGDASPTTLRVMWGNGYVPVLWSVAVEHYTVGLGLDPSRAAAHLLRDIRPGDIVLAHDGGGDRSDTVATLRILLPALRGAGFHVVSVAALFRTAQRAWDSSTRPMFWQGGLRCRGRPTAATGGWPRGRLPRLHLRAHHALVLPDGSPWKGWH